MQATKQDVEKWIDEYVRPIYLGGNHVFSVDQGRKYFRVWSQYAPDEFHTTGGQRSCWGFIDFEGNVLKAASWKKPAAHVRGNIFSETAGLEALEGHGFVRYL